MTSTARYFAALREQFGADALRAMTPPDGHTLAFIRWHHTREQRRRRIHATIALALGYTIGRTRR